MKYAFIALIAIYLVVYGCSPDSSEKATDSHDKAAPVSLEKPSEAEMVAAPAHDEHQFPAKSLETPVVVEEPAAVTELTEQPAEAVAVEPAEATQAVVEEQQEAPAVEQRVIVETEPASKEEQPAEVADSEMVVMPCGKKMARSDSEDTSTNDEHEPNEEEDGRPKNNQKIAPSSDSDDTSLTSRSSIQTKSLSMNGTPARSGGMNTLEQQNN